VTDWQATADADFAVPSGADPAALAAELAGALADPDPQVRDGAAYSALATWIKRGVLDSQLSWLGDTIAARFADERIQARTFAPLVLEWVIERGSFDPDWVRAFELWYPAETDLRGYDAELGWLHAVAHGADLLGTLGRHQQVEPEAMLKLAAQRMLADSSFVWRDQEDDRLGYAIARTLSRPGLTTEQSTGWLDLVDSRFAAGEPGPVPPFASNTIRTLRLLYLLADRGVRGAPREEAKPFANREEVMQSIANSLSVVAWFAG
jgi:hypothetical protein